MHWFKLFFKTKNIFKLKNLTYPPKRKLLNGPQMITISELATLPSRSRNISF